MTLSPVCTSHVVLVLNNPPANAGRERCEFDPWVGKIPWRMEWQPTPVLFPGESHGQRGLWGYRLHRIIKSRTRLKRQHGTPITSVIGT